MYGKYFAQTFTGSMYGAGLHVFAVWGYIIANAGKESYVELNPVSIAHALGCEINDIVRAIEYLSSPDPNSRNTLEDGRRIIKEGSYLYKVVNHQAYRSIRCDDERREYNAEAQRKHRAKRFSQGVSNVASLTVNECHDIEEAEAVHLLKRSNNLSMEHISPSDLDDDNEDYDKIPEYEPEARRY